MAPENKITPPSNTPVEQPAIPQIRTLEDDLARAKGNSPAKHDLTKPSQPKPKESLSAVVTQAEANITAQEKRIADQRAKMQKLRGYTPKKPQKKGYRPYSTVLNRAGSQTLAFDPPRSLEDLKNRPDYKPAPAHKKKKRGGLFRLFSREKKKEPTNIIDTLVDEAPKQAVKEQQATVRTYRDDLNTVIKNKKESVVSIALAEEKSRVRRSKPAPKTWPKTLLFSLASVVLLIGGGWISFLGYHYYTEQTNLPEGIKHSGLFKTDFLLEITSNNLSVSTFRELTLNNPNKSGTTNIEFTHTLTFSDGTKQTELLVGEQLLKTLVPRTPDPILRNITGDGVMYGLHHDNSTNPFLIISVASFEQALSEMLKWESTLYADTKLIMKEIDDFIKIKLVDKETIPDAPADAPDQIKVEEVVPIDKTVFKDAIIKNQDVRIIRNPFVGDPLFLYGFADPNTLIITTSGTTFSEVVDRINRSKLTK